MRNFFEEGYSNTKKKGKSYVPFSKYVTNQYDISHAKIESIFLICNEEGLKKALSKTSED